MSECLIIFDFCYGNVEVFDKYRLFRPFVKRKVKEFH